MSAAVSSRQRFTSHQPCPVCSGHALLPHGRGVRCYGFLSTDGDYAHCTRDEAAGPLNLDGAGTYAHRLHGDCHCGHVHGDLVAERHAVPFTPRSDVSHLVRELWERARSGRGTLVERYLASRGLTGSIPSSLRYAPHLRHSPTNQQLPAMVAAVTHWPSTQPVAIHRTYLRPDGSGKAPVDPNRMALGPVQGGAICLAEPGPLLAIAEGIETALSVQQTTGYPTWAAISAPNLPAVQLPPLPLAAEVVIAADNDMAGVQAAEAAAQRWTDEGRLVRIALPPAGADFNDLLMRQAA